MTSKREKLVINFFDRSQELDLKNPAYKKEVLSFFLRLVKNDEQKRDETSFSLFGKNAKKNIKAELKTREFGIVSGIAESNLFLGSLGLGCVFYKKEGEAIKPQEKILQIVGDPYKVMLSERTLINVLARMSAVAALTNQFVKKSKNKVKILGTRKTIWNLLDKKAISAGGGLTHRLNLSDAILIKDNHLAALGGDIELALKKAGQNKNIEKIEIEATSAKEALLAAQTISNLNKQKQYALMLDNMPPAKIKKTIAKIKTIKNSANILIEASGGINLANIQKYTSLGLDAVSIGALTNKACSLDFSLKVVWGKV